MGEKKKLIKLILVGDASVGKSALMSQFVLHKFPNQYKTTIGADFLSKEVQIDDDLVTIQIWDIAGQKRFQSLGIAFYREADCCVLVYDVTLANSLGSLFSWRDDVLINVTPRDPNSFPFVVVGNKVDLDNRTVSKDEGQSWFEAFSVGKSNVFYFETSAKDSTNVEKVFETAINTAVARESKMV